MIAAAYVRVSTDEQAERGHSIGEQERLIRERIGERDWELVDVFRDPGESGASENRPGLQQMLGRLDEIDVIVVWAMDRLTRDVELFGKLTKLLNAAGVQVESLTAQVDLSTPEGEAMAGVSAVFGQFERKRIAERVRAALKARKLKGQHNGGPPPDGWVDVEVGDGKERKIERVQDPDRAPVILQLFELAAQGMPDSALARHLNGNGYRTRSGRPWNRRSVQNHVTNAWHAGRVVLHRGNPDEKVYTGQHKHLIDPDAFDRIQKARGKRDLAADQHQKGRPAHRHLLAKLARCGTCGAPMFAVTSSYRRKDGTKARQYQCRSYRTGDGTCDAKPVDAEAVDAAVLAQLPRLLPRFNEWVEQIEDRHAAERRRLEEERERARDDRDAQARKLAAAERKWSQYLVEDEAKAELVLPMVERERDTLSQADARLQATDDALALIPEEAPHDRLFDFASNLRAVIAGKLDGDHSVGELNRALGELFAQFTIMRKPLPEDLQVEELDASLKSGSIYVFPNLRREVFMQLLAEYDPNADEPVPPLEWIEALAAADGKSANTHL